MPARASTRLGVTRMYMAASFISVGPIFLPRYSGVRPTMRPAMKTEMMDRISRP